MKLEEFFPEVPEFKLAATGETVHRLRLPNLSDRTKFSTMFGSEGEIQKIFKELQWNQIIKIVYILLHDKSPFKAFYEEVIDDTGVPMKNFVTGPEAMLRAISNQVESMTVLGALTSALKNSEPLMREYIDGELKKNLAAVEPMTGESSSTSSQANTGTPPNSSEVSPIAS